jgi:hypothetical protein
VLFKQHGTDIEQAAGRWQASFYALKANAG